MTNKRVLIVSTTILITTTIIVAIFGIVPLPNYGDLSSENNFDGKLIYYMELQSENIIPPAPDIVDSCIFYIDLSNDLIEEEKIICSSDLYDLSYDINFYDAKIYEQNKILLSYWDYQADNERKGLIVDIESGEISDVTNNNTFIEDNRMNVYGEKLIDPWETSDYNSRVVGVYYVDRIKTVEVFNSRAPSNYYFESLHWSPDGNSIIAGDSENNLIIFSKNKSFNPLRIELNDKSSDEDRLELIQVLGWTN
tara:strand:+ start:1060 stop:1815 length:756 start_codon:yes stop_codon:yes gene_type:complete